MYLKYFKWVWNPNIKIGNDVVGIQKYKDLDSK